jgi:hypothetical protein
MTNITHTRRSFLGTLAAAGAARARGRTQSVSSKIKEFRDLETGARVCQLTGDGSDNVHLYFTSESFVGGSNRLVFASNRSGRFQFYLLEIRERSLVQLTDGNGLESRRSRIPTSTRRKRPPRSHSARRSRRGPLRRARRASPF